jgi:hypothetical protein
MMGSSGTTDPVMKAVEEKIFQMSKVLSGNHTRLSSRVDQLESKNHALEARVQELEAENKKLLARIEGLKGSPSRAGTANLGINPQLSTVCSVCNKKKTPNMLYTCCGEVDSFVPCKVFRELLELRKKKTHPFFTEKSEYWFKGEVKFGLPKRGVQKVGKNNLVFEGEWRDNGQFWKGIKKFSDGAFYEGEWAAGKFWKGVVKMSEGDLYEGEWRGTRFWTGKETDCDGDVFLWDEGRRTEQ